jgi:NADPH:quinone reductase-like Zn-dependent oxidoreductase
VLWHAGRSHLEAGLQLTLLALALPLWIVTALFGERVFGGSLLPVALLSALLRKRLSLLATTLRGRSTEYKAALTADFARHALPLIAAGVYAPLIDRVLPLERAQEGHEALEGNETAGKIVLRIAADADDAGGE